MCLKISERSVALGITCISYTYMYAEHDFKILKITLLFNFNNFVSA